MKFKFVFLLAAVWFLAAAAADFGPVSVELKPSLSGSRGTPVGGYMIMELQIANRDRARPVEVLLELSGDYGVPRRSYRSLTLPPGGSAGSVLYWPNSGGARYGQGGVANHIFITVDGKRHQMPVHYGSAYEAAYSLGSPGIAGKLKESFQQRYGQAKEICDLPLPEWPLRQRDYAGIRDIWFNSRETVPPELQKTLDNWVFGGGVLLKLVANEAPWPEKVPGNDKDFHIEYSGFGKVIYSHLGGPYEVELARGRNRMPDWELVAANLALPVKEVPVGVLFGVMLLFVILIGPVNYFVLRRKKKTLWMLVTMPVISLFFCFGVATYITLAEGWVSTARLSGVTFLDQTARRAATRVHGGIYSPLAYRNMLGFSAADSLAFPARSGGMEFYLDQGQLLGPGAVRPRVPFYFELSRTEERFEQLRIIETGGEITVINGLGAEIDQLILCDRKGNLFRAETSVAAGARTVLKPSGSRGTGTKEAFYDSLPGPRAFDGGGLPDIALLPGFYMASLSGAAFYNAGISADDVQSRHLVIGKF